jgi:DNA-binding NarL/FixJ family response regulator
MKQVIISFELLIITVLVLLLLARVDHFYDGSIDNRWMAVFILAFITAGVMLIKTASKERISVVYQRPPLINHDQLTKAGITNREGEILVMIDEGFTNQQIADKLFIAESTVKRHTSRVCKKLHVKRPAESIKKAKEMSILL